MPGKQSKKTVTLLAPHSHGGKACKKGDKIQVSASKIAWLIKHNIIEGEV